MLITAEGAVLLLIDLQQRLVPAIDDHEAVVARAVRLADGWHGSRVSPEQAAPVVRRLREQRPEPEFTISLRYGWDGKDDGALRARLAAYGAAGVEHVLVEPAERGLEDWLHYQDRDLGPDRRQHGKFSGRTVRPARSIGVCGGRQGRDGEIRRHEDLRNNHRF